MGYYKFYSIMSTLSNWRLTTCPLHPVILKSSL